MAGDVSFDVVSDFDEQELRNALDQVRREASSATTSRAHTSTSTQGKGELVARHRRRAPRRRDQGPDRVEGHPAQPVAQDLRLGQGRAGRRQQGPPDDRPAAWPARRPRQEDHQAHPRRVPEGQVADPGRRGPRLGQEQGRAPAGDRPAARAGRGRAAPVRELPLGAATMPGSSCSTADDPRAVLVIAGSSWPVASPYADADDRGAGPSRAVAEPDGRRRARGRRQPEADAETRGRRPEERSTVEADAEPAAVASRLGAPAPDGVSAQAEPEARRRAGGPPLRA